MPVDDLVDKALDAAFDRIDDAAEPDPVKEDPKPEPTPEPEEEKPIAVEGETAEPVSDSKANAEDDKAQDVEAEDASPADASPEPIELPAFLSAETKALLAEAKPELRKKLVAQYNQQETTTRRALHEASGLKAERAKVDEVVAPHRARLAAQGISNTSDLVSRALAWDELLRTDPKAFVIAQMKQNGISPQDLFEDAGEYGSTAPVIQDPRVDEALERAAKAQQMLEDFQLNQKRAELTSKLETFKNGKDSAGQVRRAFVEMLEPQIAATVAAIKADEGYSHLTEDEVLHHAYEFEVKKAHERGFRITGAEPAPKPAKTPAEIAAISLKQKNAATSVRGAPASGTSTPRPRLKGDSFNDRLESAMDIAESRASARR